MHTAGCMLGSCRTKHVWEPEVVIFSERPQTSLSMFLGFKTECKSEPSQLTALELNTALLFFYQTWTWLLCRIELVRFLFPVGKCQKEQRTLELPSKLWLHLASQRTPWEKICSVEQHHHCHQTMGPATRASDSLTARQWKYKWTELRLGHVYWRSFFLFPCHSTSYNTTWFAKNAFWNSTGSCSLTFWPRQGGKETVIPQKEQRKINSW